MIVRRARVFYGAGREHFPQRINGKPAGTISIRWIPEVIHAVLGSTWTLLLDRDTDRFSRIVGAAGSLRGLGSPDRTVDESP